MDWLSRDEQYLWHPFTSHPCSQTRLLLTKTEGAYVYDSNGKRYFDATSSWWCQIHGHCHPRLASALKAQVEQMDQVLFAPHSHPKAIDLAEKLVGHLKSPLQKVFYSDDGSTAVETALKMAVQYWRRKGEDRGKFLSLESAYHGDTLGAMSVGQSDFFHQAFKSIRLPSTKIPLPIDDRSLQRARDVFKTEKNVAALIVEPLILGAAGMRMYDASGLQALVELARESGTLVIFDEVFTGFGRTGTMFAMEQIKARPDIVCLSKGLTSGMLPLAATVVTEEIFQAFTGGPEHAFYHGHTYTANALGVSIALESLKIFEEEGTVEKNRALSDVMKKHVEPFKNLPGVKNVRTHGMVWALDLEVAEGNALNAKGWRIAEKLLEKGIWIRPLHEILYLVPPYCSTVSDLEEVFQELSTEIKNDG